MCCFLICFSPYLCDLFHLNISIPISAPLTFLPLAFHSHSESSIYSLQLVALIGAAILTNQLITVLRRDHSSGAQGFRAQHHNLYDFVKTDATCLPINSVIFPPFLEIIVVYDLPIVLTMLTYAPTHTSTCTKLCT